MSKKRPTLAVIAGCLVAISSLFVTAPPAQAYVNADLDIKFARVRTGTTANCYQPTSRIIDFTERTNGCYHDDTGFSDYTLLKWDDGGTGLKVELHYPGRGQVAKVEFHPYDEILFIYDQYSDSDGIYVTLCTPDPNTPDCYTARGPYASSNLVNLRIDMALPDGNSYILRIWDGSGLTDLITSYVVTA